MEIIIPNLGDIDEVEVIELCVAVGDVLEKEDSVIVIESDKASMDIPAPAAGVLEALTVAVGDRIGEGHVIGTLAVEEVAADAEPVAQAEPQSESTASDIEAPVQVDSTAVNDTVVDTEIDVLVPDIGDATGVVVIEIAVKPGDVIGKNDLLVVLESDKASMEIAAEYDGTVVSVAVEVDQEVSQGSLIAVLKVDGGTGDAPSQKTADQAPGQDTEPVPQATEPPRPASSAKNEAETDVAAAAKIYAGPAVRRLARELGVSLVGIKGTGNRNRVTKEDVKAFVKTQMQSGAAGSAGTGRGLPAVPVVDYAKFGPVETVDLTRIQQRGAENLHRSWVNLPHVTQHDEVDITDLEAFRKSLKSEGEVKGVKVTPLAFLVKACCHVLREYPVFNSSLP